MVMGVEFKQSVNVRVPPTACEPSGGGAVPPLSITFF